MNNEEDFEKKFSELGDYYDIKSPGEIKKFLKTNEEIFVLLDEARPFLEESFQNEKYSLEMVYDPECANCDQLVLKIYVLPERYQNGMREDIEQLRYLLRPIRRKIQVFTKFAIRADVKNV